MLEGAEGEESESESESEDDSQERALIKIAERGGAERLAAFLERGADINGLYEGETLLCIAIHNDNEQVVNFLLNDERVDIKLNINSSEHKTGYTALHVAAQYTDLDIMKLLIEKGADVSAQDSEGETPLHWIYTGTDNNMSSSKRAEAAKLLIEARADFRIKNIEGKTALDCATEDQRQWEEDKIIEGKEADDACDEESIDMVLSSEFLKAQYEGSSSDNLLKRTRAESGDEAIGQGHGRPRLCAIEECDVSFLEDKSDVLEMGSSVVEMDYSPS